MSDEPKFVPIEEYDDMIVKVDGIGVWRGPMMEWCHECRAAHPYPAVIYCPKRPLAAGERDK